MSEDMVKTAYGILKEKIIECAYPPGSLLSANQIAGELGMSRTPIQGAFLRLEQDGYVSAVEKRGIIVRELAFRDFYEITEAILFGMIYAAEGNEDFCRVIDLKGFDVLVEECARSKADGDYISYSKQTLACFEMIASTQNNVTLMLYFRELLNKFLRYCYFSAQTNANQSKYTRLDMLRNVREALRENDRAGVIHVLWAFMRRNRETLSALRTGPLY